MAKAKKADEQPHKFINWKKVSDETGINQDKLYNNVKGQYHSLSAADCDKIADVLGTNLREVFKYLGHELKVTRSID